MPQLERFEQIVREETQKAGLHLHLQKEALEIVPSWFDTPEQQRGEICKHIRTLIRTKVEKKYRGPARTVLARVSERIAAEAIGDAKIEERNHRSASAMKTETLSGYELIRRQGKAFSAFAPRMQKRLTISPSSMAFLNMREHTLNAFATGKWTQNISRKARECLRRRNLLSKETEYPQFPLDSLVSFISLILKTTHSLNRAQRSKLTQ